ncbi:MAG: UDP-N-acetylmuramoyl-tripeptide--D-alanyl-D-alanine ligase [Solirubrobacterales bacterium]|nr:UDP-N-acetylmuramoyl-tripeptide--D-alanyl-D-alanine ligase [Solirubrobacterales bacterium]
MKALGAERIAEAAGAELLGRGDEGGPARVTIDSRDVKEGELFVGLPGERADGGQYGLEALRAGAWGILVGGQWARETGNSAELEGLEGWVMGSPEPLASLQGVGRFWRRELGCAVVGITGSTGKTSVKDICRVVLGEKVHASPENYNTEIGLPLAILGAPAGTEVMVLEMGMRGAGQIRELCEIAEPDVGVVTNIGPVHIELLGSVEAIAAAKAEIIEGLREGGAAVVPADAGPLEHHLPKAPRLLRFGEGGDVQARESLVLMGETDAVVLTPAGEAVFKFPFVEAHNLENALAAIAAGVALDIPPADMARRSPGITFSRLRGELVQLPNGAILINDSYNANPISMRAALDHLATLEVEGDRVAVLGDMRELGPESAAFHREIGEHARAAGVGLIIGVGELAADYGPDHLVGDARDAATVLSERLGPDDAVLVKGSRAVGLEAVAESLAGSGD